MAQEQRRSLDLVGVKKKLEDYEQLLQDYTLMRMKNKMKDFEAKSEEWWEVVEEYFTKELENNIVQHKVDERIIRYKLEAYQKKIPNFICGSLISIEVSGQDEVIKARPNGIAHEEEV
jgi:hypothetical protein